jgi:DNA topoisomerase-1
LAQAEQVQVKAQTKQTKQAKKKVIEKEPTAHEAIRATNLKCEDIDETQYTSRENRIYRLILQRTLESCMAEASVSVLSAVITAPQNHEYHYTTEQNIFPGWKIVGGIEPPSKEYNFLQTVKTDKMLPFKKIKAIAHLKEMKTHFTEARLVQLLEEQGIGRPSTFSSLIEKIQERKYVKKENVKGKMISCVDYEVAADDQQIKQTTTEREFGNEKNKLVIQPVGILALEFLLKHFDTFFAYSYTKEMEDDLDSVAKGEKVWQDICKKCYEEIQNLSLTILERGKEMIRIDDTHTYMVGKYGPVIKCTSVAAPVDKKGASKAEASTCTFKPVKQDLDLNKLRRGEYTLAELLEDKNKPQASIGLYKEKPVYIKVGKFGKYVEWNNVSKSLTHLKQHPNEITIDDIAEVLFDMDNAEEGGGSTRIITEDASLRKGKYGYYIYYKKQKMKKPRFLKLDGFPGDYLTCDIAVLRDWFVKKYQID